MRLFVLSVLWDLLTALAASGAEPPAFAVENKTPVFVVENKVSPRPVACFNCDKCGDACTCFGGGYYCTPASACGAQRPLKAGDTKKGKPATLPPGFEDYEWRPDSRGPDGWGLFQKSVPNSAAPNKSGVVPGPVTPPPSRGGHWVRQCDGKTCRLVWVETPPK